MPTKTGVSNNGSLLLSTRGALEIDADYWTLLFLPDARGHRKPVTVVCARVSFTLILASVYSCDACCKLPTARARELASVHGNKSMRIATARRYAWNLSDSLKFTRDVSLPSTIFSEQGDSSINQAAIYFPRKGKNKERSLSLDRRRGCRLVKFNASLNKTRCPYIFPCPDGRSVTFIRRF